MPLDVEKVTVIGAGTMGSGIAQTCAMAGLQVTLQDVKEDAVERGRERIASSLDRRVKKGKLDEAGKETILSRFTFTTELEEAVPGSDLVIEAVFEDLDVKKEVFDNVEEVADADTVFASNTSSLSVTKMARATERPDRFAGLHFFFPAHKNWLVEVVAGDGTDPELVEDLIAFSRRIGKVPIETADAAGFAVNRFFVPWVNEAVRLLDEEVANIPTIDEAAKEAFQIGMGPFELMNVTGVPISLHAQRSLHDAFGPFYRPAEGLVHQVEEVEEDWDLRGDVVEEDFAAVKERLRAVAFGVAAHLVDEGVATARDTDKGALIGLRWSKGPFQLMNDMGLEDALETVETLHDTWGDAFPVPGNLEELAEAGDAWSLPKARVERGDDGVATVLVDRPEAMNALNSEVLEDLRAAFRSLEEDEDVRCVILTGESPKAFVAGADIKEMKGKTPLTARRYTQLGQDVLSEIEGFRTPVIAAVNGVAFGGGLELALASDLILGAEESVVGLPEVNLGIHPGFGGTQRLPRLIGVQEAKRLVYTADRIGAAEAEDIGLFLNTHPRGDLLIEARGLAERIASQAPIAVEQAKMAMNQGLQVDLESGLALEREAVTLTFGTEDQVEGMEAFVERREPEFEGK